MINVPTIYADVENQIGNDLSIPQRRKPVWLNWLRSILTPQQWLNDLVFTKYYAGSNATVWVSGNPYVYGDDVIYLDNSVYECINPLGVTSTEVPNLDADNWIKILDTFIGVGERVKYTGQKMFLEYLLNKYFMVGYVGLIWFGSQPWYNDIEYVAGQVVYYSDGKLYTCILNTTSFQNPTDATYWVLNPQIFIIRNTVVVGDFWMGTQSEGIPQSYMPIDSSTASNWMPITSAAQQLNSFTIYVPSVVAGDINAKINLLIPNTQDTYKELINSIVSPYVRAGKIFNITTY